MKKDLDFQTYNQIHKLFKVVAMSIKEVMNNPKWQDNKCLVLLDKPTIDTPRNKPRQHIKTTKQLLIEFMQNQESFNKTILERLDKYDKLFKQHGWTK